MNSTGKAVALLPTHNGERYIRDVVKRLADQTMPIDIIVVSDNSTDKTVEIVKELQKEYPGLLLYETVNNTRKKAGALNQAIKLLDGKDYKYMLVQDGDTLIDQNLVEQGIKELEADDNIAAVCSRAGVLDHEPGIGWWNRLLWRFQKIEYAAFDSQRVETLDCIRVVHGMAAIFRLNSLREVEKYRKSKWNNNGIFDENNLIEDFELTVCLRELGYKVTVSMMMRAWTDVPTSLKSLWRQRLRWFRGSLDTLKTHGLNKITAMEYVQHGLFIALTTINIVVLAIIAYMVANGAILSWSPLFLLVVLAVYLNGLYRLKYVQDLQIADVLLVALYVPYSLYHVLYQAELIWAYVLTIRKVESGW